MSAAHQEPTHHHPAAIAQPPFRVRRLDHVVIRARDAAALIRFYAEVLGCRVEREVASVGLTQLRAGDSLIDVVSASGELGRSGGGPPERGQGHNVDHFCLQVDPFDANALTAHLARHNVSCSPVRNLYGAEGVGPSVYIEDPEGNRVELKGPPQEPAQRQEPGGKGPTGGRA